VRDAFTVAVTATLTMVAVVCAALGAAWLLK